MDFYNNYYAEDKNKNISEIRDINDNSEYNRLRDEIGLPVSILESMKAF